MSQTTKQSPMDTHILRRAALGCVVALSVSACAVQQTRELVLPKPPDTLAFDIQIDDGIQFHPIHLQNKRMASRIEVIIRHELPPVLAKRVRFVVFGGVLLVVGSGPPTLLNRLEKVLSGLAGLRSSYFKFVPADQTDTFADLSLQNRLMTAVASENADLLPRFKMLMHRQTLYVVGLLDDDQRKEIEGLISKYKPADVFVVFVD